MEIVRTEPITRERWLNLFARTFRHAGKEHRWVFASRHPDPPIPPAGVDAVLIVPTVLTPGEPPRLVVTREFRVPLAAYEYSFPAGLVDAGESVEETARRELREETGLEVVDFTKISPPTYSSAGMTDESVVIAFVTARRPEGATASPQDAEDIETLLLDHRQVSDLCDSGVRVNGRAWAILYLFQQLGRLG
jgi:ADP-ribose pyrophosphatase